MNIYNNCLKFTKGCKKKQHAKTISSLIWDLENQKNITALLDALIIERKKNERITDGPFLDFLAEIDEIYPDRSKVKVLVSFFGRETPVELDFLQVEKT